jgi:hypothetical protein
MLPRVIGSPGGDRGRLAMQFRPRGPCVAPVPKNKHTFPMTKWLRIVAWLSVLGLALASWTPGEHMIRTGVKGSLEHMTAYLI